MIYEEQYWRNPQICDADWKVELYFEQKQMDREHKLKANLSVCWIMWMYSSSGPFCTNHSSICCECLFASKHRQTSVNDSLNCKVSLVCVVYVILVIHRLHPSSGSYPIQQLHSEDRTQLYQGRILLSANVRKRKINACLSCLLSHDWSSS